MADRLQPEQAACAKASSRNAGLYQALASKSAQPSHAQPAMLLLLWRSTVLFWSGAGPAADPPDHPRPSPAAAYRRSAAASPVLGVAAGAARPDGGAGPLFFAVCLPPDLPPAGPLLTWSTSQARPAGGAGAGGGRLAPRSVTCGPARRLPRSGWPAGHVRRGPPGAARPDTGRSCCPTCCRCCWLPDSQADSRPCLSCLTLICLPCRRCS